MTRAYAAALAQLVTAGANTPQALATLTDAQRERIAELSPWDAGEELRRYAGALQELDARAHLTVPCYVVGCRELADRSAIHRARGRVRSCGTHDPSRHGYAAPFVRVQVQGIGTLLAQADERPDIGPMPPVRPIEPAPMPPPPANVVSFAF